MWAAESEHTVPYVPSAASEGHAGVVRIESRSASPGEVRIMAVDDAGQRVEAGRLTLGAGAAVEFEMAALESGDALPGLEGTGPGEGGLASGAFDGSGHRGARVRAVGRFSDRSARRRAAVG